MKRTTLRLGLSLIITVGAWTNRLPAEPQTFIPGEVMLVPIVPYAPAHHPYYGLPLESAKLAAPQPELAKCFLRRLLNYHGVGCQANRDGAVGDIHSDLLFLYGSSRNFFGDVCYPHQPCFSGHGSR